ncbi:cytochrome P450 [Streptomyces yaizuensis]|uniref:Cytochrome P450 n=1 Tax=Streptomyces yaizuensis TaxID=2989713 RepID=A0ABQ5NX42_9ACTN|nr:cytochrome P450 [Streptomyces sp. YSPA8]GLF94938.1 cytochrome P450 [Streptomyces sp. YSPA8]
MPTDDHRPGTLLRRISDYANRADPYPLYAELREHKVAQQDDGSYLVGTYHEIVSLLHDPRISSDPRHRTEPPEQEPGAQNLPPSFIALDDPEHDRLRRIANRPFGPPHTPGLIDSLTDDITAIADELITALASRDRIDLVDDFAFPLPVTVICRLLGVPAEDIPQVHAWTTDIIASLDFDAGDDVDQRRRTALAARDEMADYLGRLAGQRRGHPTGDMLSAFVGNPGGSGDPGDPGAPGDPGDGRPYSEPELKATTLLLLIAGHETTVNLITNGMLTLLRNPDTLTLLRETPDLMPAAVEEILRYEPPLQLLPQRTPLTDIDIAGVTVPQGVPLILALAAGNRDPLRFADPDRFDITRADNQHLGFGSGVHNCYGAPLARVETRIALTLLLTRLDRPSLAEDPPPYRRSPILRGPRHLPLALGNRS